MGPVREPDVVTAPRAGGQRSPRRETPVDGEPVIRRGPAESPPGDRGRMQQHPAMPIIGKQRLRVRQAVPAGDDGELAAEDHAPGRTRLEVDVVDLEARWTVIPADERGRRGPDDDVAVTVVPDQPIVDRERQRTSVVDETHPPDALDRKSVV